MTLTCVPAFADSSIPQGFSRAQINSPTAPGPNAFWLAPETVTRHENVIARLPAAWAALAALVGWGLVSLGSPTSKRA